MTRRIFVLFGALLTVFLCGCSDNGGYLDIQPEWLRKEWKLEGRIDGCDISSSKWVGMKIYWDEKEEFYIAGPTIEIGYDKDATSIRPGQLTYGHIAWFLIDEDDGDKLVLRRMNGEELTYTVIVRFLQEDNDGTYTLHVNYEGKSYQLKGYPKD